MNYKKKLVVILSLITLCFTFNTAKAQLTDKYTNYEELEHNGLKYGFYKPLNYDKSKAYPIVLILNGFTDTTSHDFVYYKESFQKKNPCFVLSPKCYGNPYKGGGWVDPLSNTLLNDGKLAMEILDNTIQKYNVDTNRLYIHGGSMGGYGTFGILSNYPEKFAAWFY